MHVPLGTLIRTLCCRVSSASVHVKRSRDQRRRNPIGIIQTASRQSQTQHTLPRSALTLFRDSIHVLFSSCPYTTILAACIHTQTVVPRPHLESSVIYCRNARGIGYLFAPQDIFVKLGCVAHSLFVGVSPI